MVRLQLIFIQRFEFRGCFKGPKIWLLLPLHKILNYFQWNPWKLKQNRNALLHMALKKSSQISDSPTLKLKAVILLFYWTPRNTFPAWRLLLVRTLIFLSRDPTIKVHREIVPQIKTCSFFKNVQRQLIRQGFISMEFLKYVMQV